MVKRLQSESEERWRDSKVREFQVEMKISTA